MATKFGTTSRLTMTRNITFRPGNCMNVKA